MPLSFPEDAGHSTRQEISPISCNQKVYYCVRGNKFLILYNSTNYCTILTLLITFNYVAGSSRFRHDIQKPRQMENAVRDM